MSSSDFTDRIRFLAGGMGCVFVLGWVAWFSPFDDLLDRRGTPLGADFSMFYVAGQIARSGDSPALYDQAEHQRVLHGLFPGLAPEFCLPYRYPPAVALAMTPLARISYPVAFGCFVLFSCVALALSLRLLSSQFPLGSATTSWNRTAILACVCWPVTLEVFIGGQASMLALTIAVTTVCLLRTNHQVLAGAVLALSAYKPNVLALFAIGIAIRYPRVIVGAIPVIAAVAGSSYLGGKAALHDYLALTLNLTSQSWDVETPFWKAHSLAGWFDSLLQGRGRLLSLASGITAALLVAGYWRWADVRRSQRSNGSRSTWDDSSGSFSAAVLLAMNSIFNPYTPIYDLVLLIPAVWFFVAGMRQPNALHLNPITTQFCLAILFFGPHGSQACAKAIGFQLFPGLLLAICAWGMFRLLRWRASSVELPCTGSPSRSAAFAANR